MTILGSVAIKCDCKHVYNFPFPQSITTWMYPEMVEKLVNGGYYNAVCPECGLSIVVKGEIMINQRKPVL